MFLIPRWGSSHSDHSTKLFSGHKPYYYGQWLLTDRYFTGCWFGKGKYVITIRKIGYFRVKPFIKFWESKDTRTKKRLYILTFVLFSYIFSIVLEKSVEISWSVNQLHLLQKKTNSQQLVALTVQWKQSFSHIVIFE